MDVTQRIRVSQLGLDYLFTLPCVQGAVKTVGGYYLTVDCDNGNFAEIGDELCETRDHHWWVAKHKAGT